jgi:hypothetical protein
MLHLRPTTGDTPAHRNLHADWLDSLSEDDFHAYVAGRLSAPIIGGQGVNIGSMWLGSVGVALAVLAVLFILNHL